MNYYFFIISVCLVLVSCESEDKGELSKEEKKDSSYSVVANQVAVKKPEQLTDAKGIIGVFDVPEMLTVAKLDSARLANVPAVLAKNYGLVEKDIAYMKVK